MRPSKLIVYVSSLGFLASSFLAAQTQSSERLRFTERDLTVLGVTIGLSNKEQIQNRFGKAVVFKTSKGESADDVICYANQGAIVAFHFGALGGWQDATSITLADAQHLPWSIRKCAVSKLVSRNIRLPRTLLLGSSTGDTIKALGPPTKSSPSNLRYYVTHSCDINERRKNFVLALDPCEEVNIVTAKFVEDRLVFINVAQFIDH